MKHVENDTGTPDRAEQLRIEGQEAVKGIQDPARAWHEAAVIRPMLDTCLARWGKGNFRIFVGVYPNDPETIREASAVAEADAPMATATS